MRRNHFVFGPFELRPQMAELRKNGIRVRLPAQPFQILVFLVRNAGETVSREQLREQVWAAGTFVDFERGLNVAINKVRQALNDSARSPHYIETVAGQGYRFIGELAESDPTSPPVVSPLPRRSPGLWWMTAVLPLAIVVPFWIFKIHPAPKPIWKLTRITPSSMELAETPALSPDGKLLAYSSDADHEGSRDLYLQEVPAGKPVRITFDGANNASPDFSPDGRNIVFSSGRDSGGIYEIPAFGGSARAIAPDGFDPKYSRDGREIAYWKGARSISATVPGTGEVWIVPANGGQPRRVASQLTTARNPIWAPNGKSLLLIGYEGRKAFDRTALDWWIASADGSSVARTGAYDILIKAGLWQAEASVTPVPYAPQPGCWSAPENKVTFSRMVGDTRNIWQFAISPQTGRVLGGLERLTTGAGNEIDPSCAAEAFVFASINTRANLWSFPANPDSNASDAAPKPVAPEAAEQRHPSWSKDGHVLAFLSTRSGPGNIWVREIPAGKEQAVAPSPLVQGYPVVNPAGDRVAYDVYERENRRVLYVAAPGRVPEKLCDGCLRATDWSSSGKSLLVFAGDPYQIDLLDFASRRRTALLKHPAYGLLYARFSPDNRWISFTARTDSNHGRIFIAPFSGFAPILVSAWIPVADVDTDDNAIWSPDGTALYFTSSKDGFACLWRQPLDPASHAPKGEPFAVHHFHGRLRFSHTGFSLSNSRIAMPLVEKTGGIWMMSRSNEVR
jgi:Tol biopolymer transport system component/DNA-binding winged helix-turn-helix (wHTH) protein